MWLLPQGKTRAPASLITLLPKENKSRQIRQFHFHGWPEVGIPSDGKGMISIIAAVQKQQQQSGNHPITVHCRYHFPQPSAWERKLGEGGRGSNSGESQTRTGYTGEQHLALDFSGQHSAG